MIMMMSSSSSAAFRTEVAVIGAGVVGLAIARSLAMAGKEVLLLERASTICSETSSRNSEVIHAGLYYPKSSWKAKFCVQGKKLIYEFCNTHNVPYKNCGKLIVATTQQQFDVNLYQLQQQAISNDVLDTQIITSDDVKYLEPNIHCVGGALLSPSTGVFDSHSFCLGLLGDAEYYGAILSLNTNVDDATILAVSSNNNNNNNRNNNNNNNTLLLLHADGTWIECDTIINSAGLSAHKIAEMIHNNSTPNTWKPPKQYFAKGTYFRLQGIKSPFQHLIYPIPEPGGLGVHATIDYTGQTTKFGPDVEWVDPYNIVGGDIMDNISLIPDIRRGLQFYDKIRRYWPDLPDNTLIPDYVGIRPKLVHPQLLSSQHGSSSSTSSSSDSSSLLDFNILGPEVHGVSGLIHLMGIESPGLTSSMAIADYVRDMVLKEKMK